MTVRKPTLNPQLGMSGVERNEETMRVLAKFNKWPAGFDEELISIGRKLSGWSFWWRPAEGRVTGGCIAVPLDGAPQGSTEIVAETPRALAELVRAKEAEHPPG